MFVLALTAVKDAIEDYAKHVADAIENSRTTARLESYNIATPTTITSAGVRVGDVIMVKNREFIPADMVLLASSEGQSCHVMTANLGATICVFRAAARARARLRDQPRPRPYTRTRAQMGRPTSRSAMCTWTSYVKCRTVS